ncbi:MAG TPA: glutaredoxin domain-containing protein [Steroidobacteraceae bacterium]|nr:glutaredoxin domain-containing protein [Steroidobacteraceae bacterium]
MKLTPAQAAALKRLQKYRVAAPALGERLRLAAGFMLLLLLPVLLLGYLTVRLHFPGGLLLLAGLYVGAVAREIGQQRRFVHYWSLSREITDWDKVEQFLSGAEELPPIANPDATPKTRIGYAAAIGLAIFALVFGAAIAAERTLAYVYNPTRNNPPRHVIVLSASWCPYCMSLRHHLTGLKVPYTDLDTEKTTEGRWAFVAIHGTGIPVTIVGDQVIRGLGKESPWGKVDAALKSAGYVLPADTAHDD